MTIKQALRKAAIITIATTIGGSVRITKKEAKKYIARCDENGYEYKFEYDVIYSDRLLVAFN